MAAPPRNPPRHLVSVATAAEYMELHDRTIRRYIDTGILTGYRLGPRAIRVDLNELDGLLRAIPNATAADRAPSDPASRMFGRNAGRSA